VDPERKVDPMTVRSWVAALVVAMAALGSADGAWAQGATGETLLQRAGSSRSKGQESAPVLVFEISNFQCPYCARFSKEIFPRIDSAYVATGKVRWVFVNLPLPGHLRSWNAAKAALCAGAVGDGFWPVHDRLFVDISEWARAEEVLPVLVRYAREAGVPEEAFRRCMAEDRVAPLIVEDLLNAARSGVRGTPTFFIGEERQPLVGLQPFEVWTEVLDRALQAAPAANRR
jgi:protein-disulfide isomerase